MKLPEPREGFLAVGLVRRAHGLHGELRVEAFAPGAPRLQPGRTVYLRGLPFTVAGLRPERDTWLVTLDGIDTREDAEVLAGSLIEAPETDVERDAPDAYFLYELVGLRVELEDGTLLGEITEVMQPGANDVYVVTGESGELLVPAIGDVVQEIDVTGGRIIVRAIPGLLE
jgi:16S rRNA processing protein RimM